MKNLIALSVLFALKESGKTARILLAVVGEWKGHRNGPFKITAEDLATIKANFDRQKIETVIDYEHMSLWGDKAPAAGWIKELSVEGENLWAEVEWLPEAAEEIKTGKYKYISPVLQEHTVDQVSGEDVGWSLHSAALTNRPFLEELGEVKANSKNQPQNTKEEEVSKEALEKLQKENGDLQAKLQEHKDKEAERMVDDAIAAKKLSPAQRDAALKMCKADPEGFGAFVKGAVAKEAPENDLYANTNQGAPVSGGDLCKHM